MSGYSSLLSPIMEATSGLIASSALNTTAQGALNLASVNALQIQDLEENALQILEGEYKGFDNTNMLIDGGITCTQVSINQGSFNGNNLSLSTLTEPYISTELRQVNNDLRISLDPSGQVIFNSVNVAGINELTCSTLNYTTLNPPVSGGSLSQVLTNGNDGDFKSMTNLNTVSCSVVQATNTLGTALSKFNNFEVFSDDANTRTATFNAAGDSAVQNYYLYGVQPSDFKIGIDKNILTTGNITCNQLNYTTLNPPISSEWVGTAASILNMADYAIQNTPSITFRNIDTFTGIVSFDTSGSLDFDTMNLKSISGIECNSVNATTSVSTNDIIATGNIDTAYLTVKNPGSGDTVASIDGGGTITSTSLVIGDTLGSYAQIASTGAITCGTVNEVSIIFKPTYDYYVAKGGSDIGLGSIISPYLTIQHAIDLCNNETQQDGVPRVIHVSAGSFTENLTFSKSRISVKGQGVGTHPDIGTSITGTITITITDGNSDLHNNNITLSGFLLVGTVEDNTTLDRPHRLALSNCHIYANDRCLYIHPVFDYRCFVSNCVFSNDSLVSTDPLVQCAGLGMVSFTQNQMTAKGASQNVFKLSGTCRIDLFAQNVLTSDSIGTNVAVAIFNHNSTQTIILGQNAFVYGNSGAKRNLETASGVFLNNTGSLVLLSNTFSLSGLASSQMAVYSTSLSFPTTIIIYGANISTSNPLALTATGISGSQGTTKVATLSVQ